MSKMNVLKECVMDLIVNENAESNFEDLDISYKKDVVRSYLFGVGPQLVEEAIVESRIPSALAARFLSRSIYANLCAEYLDEEDIDDIIFRYFENNDDIKRKYETLYARIMEIDVDYDK